MSIAFKCDRCEKCFDPYDIKDPKYFVTLKGFFCQNGVEFANNEYGYAEHDAGHLCPECSEKWARFMDNAPVEDVKYDGETAMQIIRETESIIHETILDCLHDCCAGDRTDSAVGKSEPCRRCRVPESHGQAPERKKRAKKDGE